MSQIKENVERMAQKAYADLYNADGSVDGVKSRMPHFDTEFHSLADNQSDMYFMLQRKAYCSGEHPVRQSYADRFHGTFMLPLSPLESIRTSNGDFRIRLGDIGEVIVPHQVLKKSSAIRFNPDNCIANPVGSDRLFPYGAVPIDPSETYSCRKYVKDASGNRVRSDITLSGQELIDAYCTQAVKDCDKKMDALQSKAEAALTLMSEHPKVNRLVRSYMIDADRIKNREERSKTVSDKFYDFREKVFAGFDKVRTDIIPTVKNAVHGQKADELVADMESRIQNSTSKNQMSL